MSTNHSRALVRNAIFFILSVMLIEFTAYTASAVDAPLTDDGFVRDAILSNQTDIEISKVMMERSKNTSLKKLAKTIIKDQDAANTQLRSLAAAKNLPIPPALNDYRRQQVDKFKSSGAAALEASYREQIQQCHSAAIVLYERVAKNPRSDAELRVFAFKMLPILRKHQQAIAKAGGSPIAVAAGRSS
jgi:putative membrane protein